jgi:hypothetical protein
MIGYVDSFNYQNIAVFLNFTACFRGEKSLTGRYLARFQRAAEGAGQSAGGRGDHIIKGGGLRFVDIRIHPVVLGNLGMHAEFNRLLHQRQISPA